MLALGLGLGLATAAPLPGSPIAAQPGSWVSTYSTPFAAVPVGGELTFANGDVFRHNVVALDAFGADDRPWCGSFAQGRCPLFWSLLIGTGATTPVLGLDQLEATQTYTFYCTLHPVMEGTLLALPAP